MNPTILIKKIPFELPKSIIQKVESTSTLSDQLALIRNWVHTNTDINHEKRLEWHKPILE